MWTYLLLAGGGFVAWIISTVGGGGGAMLLVPFVAFLLGAQAVAPVATAATLLAGGGRAFLFWRDIDWRIARWALPGSVLGGVLGSALFSNAPAEWLQIFVGLFLISTTLQYRFGEKERTFEPQPWWFFPAELLVGFLSGLIGATGPVMNTLYLNAGLVKERMIGTKTAVSLPTHFAQIGTYAAFGAMNGRLLLYGLAAGLGALASNWLAKRIVGEIRADRFRLIVIGVMALSGVSMVWEQRNVVAALFQ